MPHLDRATGFGEVSLGTVEGEVMVSCVRVAVPETARTPAGERGGRVEEVHR
ncbi:MAG: hypothetical protein PVI57_12445 [Gemmatimonadota bacterium]